MLDIIKNPRYTIIEQIAVNIAAQWYEIGRGQGMTSKHKDAKSYAKANIEKFIPKAVELALEMIGPNSTLPKQAKDDIFAALQERHNDPTLNKYMPNVDVKKAIEYGQMLERKKPPIEIKTLDAIDKIVKDINPKKKDLKHG